MIHFSTGIRIHHISHPGHQKDGRQRRRHHFGQTWKKSDDRHGDGHQSQHQPQSASAKKDHGPLVTEGLEAPQLGEQNHHRQPIHKSQHDRMGHDANEFAQLQKSSRHLKKSAEDHRWKQVADAVVGNQSNHNHPHGARGSRNHARSSPQDRCHQTQNKRGVQTNQRGHTSKKGEGHRLGYQRQRDGQSRENVGSWRSTGPRSQIK